MFKDFVHDDTIEFGIISRYFIYIKIAV